MKSIIVFSWGYWGWGTATDKLVEAFDAAERERGFQPPLFVDIRLKRVGRAPGFQGDNFRNTLDKAKSRRAFERNYIHMPSLGNLGILGGTEMKIKEPKDAEKLLDEAVDAAGDKRRLIFFCACKAELANFCHRYKVGGLVLKAAKRRNIPVQIVEWPGGDPEKINLEVSENLLREIQRSTRRTISFGDQVPLAKAAVLPWGTIANLRSTQCQKPVVVGPARFERGEWVLPVFASWGNLPVQQWAKEIRKTNGWNPRAS